MEDSFLSSGGYFRENSGSPCACAGAEDDCGGGGIVAALGQIPQEGFRHLGRFGVYIKGAAHELLGGVHPIADENQHFPPAQIQTGYALPRAVHAQSRGR